MRLCDGLYYCSPPPGISVGEQAKGTGAARVMTTAAVVVQDGRNLSVERDRSRSSPDASMWWLDK